MAGSGRGSAERSRRVALLRGAGFVIALLIGAASIWFIVTGTSQRAIRIGALGGFWALLLGAFAIFGSRAPQREPEPVAAPAPALPRPLAAAGRELDLRQVGEIERAAVAAARREFQAELEQMLRREVQAGLASEVAGLRSEVAALRNELVEKVGGQLRLERIETTRLIGSDLEALQHELRQLRHVGGSDFEEFGESFGKSLEKSPGLPAPVNVAKLSDATPVPVPVPQRVPDIQDAEVVPEPAVTPEPVAAPAVVPEPVAPEPAVVPEPAIVAEARVPEPAVETAPEAAELPAPIPAPPVDEPAPTASREPEAAADRADSERADSDGADSDGAADPFASMPRLSRFTDFDLDPVPAGGTSEAAAAGRHSTSVSPAGRTGRRHRADDSENDTLARILARENR